MSQFTSNKQRSYNGPEENGISYTVGDQRYTQYVSMPMETQQMTTLEQLAGYAIKEEAIINDNKVYMVLEGSSSSSSENTVVVGPDMPNLEQFEENVQANTEQEETLYYVVGNDNTLTDSKGKQVMVSDPMHIIDSVDTGKMKKGIKKQRVKNKGTVLKDQGPDVKYPPPGCNVPMTRRGLRNKPGCKHCKHAYQEEISNLTSHYCGYCDYGTYEIQALNTHMKAEHALDKKKWLMKCNQCNYTTVCRSNLKYHCKYLHENIGTIYCNFCTFSSKIRKDYYLHVIDDHTGERPHACPFCLYRTNVQTDLDRHMGCLHPDQIYHMYG